MSNSSIAWKVTREICRSLFKRYGRFTSMYHISPLIQRPVEAILDEVATNKQQQVDALALALRKVDALALALHNSRVQLIRNGCGVFHPRILEIDAALESYKEQ